MGIFEEKKTREMNLNTLKTGGYQKRLNLHGVTQRYETKTSLNEANFHIHMEWRELRKDPNREAVQNDKSVINCRASFSTDSYFELWFSVFDLLFICAITACFWYFQIINFNSRDKYIALYLHIGRIFLLRILLWFRYLNCNGSY